VSGCSAVIRSGIIGMARCARVPFGGNVVVMGIVRVGMLHPREMGKLEFPPPLEVVSS
jgi:hypothetical protein